MTTGDATLELEQPGGADGVRPVLADGIELIGRFEDSGFKNPPYVVRRADGQVVQLPRLLYLIGERSDGRRDYQQIAEEVSAEFGRGLTGDNVRYLADEKLRPLGLLKAPDGSSPQVEKLDPLLALKLRTAVVPESVVRAITRLFKPLFLPPVVVAVLAALGAVDVWLFFVHGIAGSVRELLYNPVLVLMVLGLVALSAAFHECGHATACAYGGAKPGTMGVGIYLVWPAFYTDVTDAYRLGKAGRLRTDLGGVYFNAIFILATVGAYVATGFEPLLLLVPLQHVEIAHQFLPFIRLDGYYIVSDLTGVPDMFSRIKPTLASLIPWRKADDRVAELKPWVRGAVTAYVLTVVPILVAMFGLMLLNAPRVFATAWDSFFLQLHRVREADSLMSVAVGSVQMGVLTLPAAGIVATFAQVGKRTGRAAWARTEGEPLTRGAFVTMAAVAAASVGFVWWPNGEYRPIQPGERGTLQGAVRQVAAVPSGRPALTKQRERELRGAPLRSQSGTKPEQAPGETTTPTGTTSTIPSDETTSTTPSEETTTTTSTEPTTTTTAETTTTPTDQTTTTTTTP